MRITIIILGLTLVVQAVIAASLIYSGPSYDAFEAQEPLLVFETKDVDEIKVSQTDEGAVTLRKERNDWVLPELYDFPADSEKVTNVLERLVALKRGLPVSVTSSAPKRFKLTEDEHERYVELIGNNDTIAELYLGTSPTFRKLHVRVPGEDEVFNVEFATFETPTEVKEWMDNQFLNINEDDLQRIELDDLALVWEEGDLTVEGLQEGESTVANKAESLVTKITEPTIDAVDGKGEEALAKLTEPEFSVTLKRSDETERTYQLQKIEDEDMYYLVSSEHDFLFRVPTYSVQEWLDASREVLVEGGAPSEDDEATTDSTDG